MHSKAYSIFSISSSVAFGFLAEVSTIPLNIAWTLNEIEKTDNKLYKLSCLSTIILYIPFRLINLPYIELIDSNNNNILMSQSSACLAYFGNKFKLLGNNKYEESDCFQLLLLKIKETHVT